MRKKNALFLFFCLVVLKAAGQTNISPDLQKIVPPSPNAAALGKFADMPVNTHTGIPKVGVPVYNWADNNSGLSLNISLDYHAGGVKVEEISSNVGLGWALNAGGVITRTMRGLPDEDAAGFLNTPVLPDIATTAFDGEFVYADLKKNENQYSPSYVLDWKNMGNRFSILNNYLRNDIDTQQDIFYYNFNGRSGKFFIAKDGSILLQTKDNLKIIPVKSGGNKLYSFEIIDDKGLLYTFSNRENTNSQSRTEGSDAIVPMYSYISSWYLSGIKSADRLQQITFNYETYKQDYESGFSESWSINHNDDPSTVEFDKYLKTSHTHSYNYTGIDGLRLNNIILPDFSKVEFSYSATPREDVHLDQALHKITIVNGARSFGVILTQSYFDSGNPSLGYFNKRLKLDRVTEFGGGINKKPYQFIYNLMDLPTRNSMKQDYWGYALLRHNTTLISQLEVLEGEISPVFFEGADRSPEPSAVKAASLEKVIYPTGGSTEFEMENNYGFSENYATIQKTEFLNFSQDGGNLNYRVNMNEASSTAISVKIKINEISRTKPDGNSPIDFPEEAIDYAPVSIVLTKTDGSWSTVVYTGNYEGAKAFGIKYLTIPAAGSYYLKFNYEDLSRVIFTVAAEINYPVKPQEKIAGGMRIKRMISRPDEINGHELVKEYDYALPNGKSSGILATAPNYNYYKTTTSMCRDFIWLTSYGILERINRSSESTQPLGSVQGSPIGYSKVTVKEGNNGQSNGYATYEFSPLEYFSAVNYYPYSPGEYISWGAGLPLKEESYSASGILLRSLENTYAIHRDQYVSEQNRSLKVALVFNDICRGASENRFSAIVSYPVFGMAQKTRQKERIFNGTAYVETLSDYVYEPVYNQLTETKVKTSTGTVINKLFYPYQYTGVPVLQEMTRDNRIVEPVKTESWKVNNGVAVLAGGAATTYDWKDNKIRKSKVYEANLKAPLAEASALFDPNQQLSPIGYYEAKLSFEKYNEKGVPVYALSNDKVKSSWIWAADGIHLNASVNNADQTEVYFENFESTGNSNTGHTGKKSYTGNFTADFNAPNGKQYLISYWLLQGDQWVFSGELAYTKQALSGTIDDVRIYPADAYMTTYTHEPLAGISSSTDPKGQTTYYEYDNFLRLLNVKDHQQNIIKNNTYNYKP